MSNGNKNDADTGHKPKWTVMIYMAGDNNLTEECIYSLTEMRKVNLGRDLQVFVQYDPKDEFLPVKRYQINLKPSGSLEEDQFDEVQANGEFKCESPRMKPYRRFTGDQKERRGEGFSGDPAALYNFIAFCLDEKPRSEHYFLIICGHGAGIQRDYLLKDDGPEGYLTLKELCGVFEDVHRAFLDDTDNRFVFDMFGMDTCLMSMAEIVYELRDHVKIAIASPSYAPASGWPYRDVLEAIKSSLTNAGAAVDTSTPSYLRGLAKRVVDEYVAFYADYSLGGLSVTQSALDVRLMTELVNGKKPTGSDPGFGGLKALADIFSQELETEYQNFFNKYQSGDDSTDIPPPSRAPFTSALILSHWEAQSYNGELYVDLVDFLRLLAGRHPDVREMCCQLANFIQRQVVIASCYSGRKFQWTYGMSIYFPWDLVLPYYADAIDFPKHSGWIEFLQKYTRGTRRPPRNRMDGEENLVRKNYEDVRMGPDKMGPDKSQIVNPIHSMRNPPIVVRKGKQCPPHRPCEDHVKTPTGRKPPRPKVRKSSN